jgi:hypothetical protein
MSGRSESLSETRQVFLVSYGPEPLTVTLPPALAEEVRSLHQEKGIPIEKLLVMIEERAFETLPPLTEMAAHWVLGKPLPQTADAVPPPYLEQTRDGLVMKIKPPKIPPPSARPRAPRLKLDDL